jgi:hypothetical protein
VLNWLKFSDVQGLSFLHPWLLAGAIAAALPIIIHLIGKRRAPSVRFAAFDFLLAVNARLAKRERLRQFLLLLLRTLAVLALVFAIARPIRPQTAVNISAARKLAIVIDTSASMAYEIKGETLLSRAQTKAVEALSHLQPGDTATLISAGPTVRAWFEVPSPDHAAVKAAITKIGPTAGTADLGAAMDAAIRQFGNSSSGTTLMVIGDLAANSFDHLVPTANKPEIKLIDAADRNSPAPLLNLAIESVAVDPSGEAPLERRIRVKLRNYGGEKAVEKPLELWVNGTTTQRINVAINARSSEEKLFNFTFADTGIFYCEIRLLAEDHFPADDIAYFVVNMSPDVKVLMVNGDPRTTPYEDETFFLEHALAAVPKGDPAITIHTLSPDELTDNFSELQDVQVVILANISELSAAQLTALQAFVQNGGGLLFSLGDKVNFETANAAFAPLLPHPLRDEHLAEDPNAGTPALSIGDFDWNHPVLRGLGLPLEESLHASHTARYFNVDVGAQNKARIVLRFDNSAPALLEAKRADRGHVMLWTSSLDVDMSDVPLRSGFPALMQNIVRYLAGRNEESPQITTKVGNDLDMLAPTNTKAMAIISPKGVRKEATLEESATLAHFTDLAEVGIYRVEIQKAGSWLPAPWLDFGVNPSLAESDFTPVNVDHIASQLSDAKSATKVAISMETSAQTDPFALRGFASYWLLALCLFFASESLLASRG